MNNASLHHAIIRSFLDRQRPPSHAELSERFGCSPDAVRAGLRALADDHGVVLHPHSDAVWVAHPFSAAPTACLVRAEGKTWWASCIWCALGLAHLAGGTATIEARHGGLGAPVGLRLEGGALLDPDHCVHFPIPMQRAWDNVHFTCAVMLLFPTPAAVADWCAERGVPHGDVRPLAQVSAFAADWYARHADPGWRKWSLPEAAALFRRHGLDGPTWSLPAAEGRF